MNKGKVRMRWLPCALFMVAASSSGWAQPPVEPVWHCSKTVLPESVTKTLSKRAVSALSLSNLSMINIQLMDLFKAYSGEPVLMSGKRLSACFLDTAGREHTYAMSDIGVNANTSRSLARRASIVQNLLYGTGSDEEMEACIIQHHPAVGYLSTIVETQEIGPCF